MFGTDLKMDTVEFFDDASNAERRQLPQAVSPPGSKGLSGESRIAKVLGAAFLNMRPFLTFFIMAEAMLSRSKSSWKSCLAWVIISGTWRGFLASLSMSYMILIW